VFCSKSKTYLKNKKKTGSKPEKRVNSSDVDFEYLFKESRYDAGKTLNKLSETETIETESEEKPEREQAKVEKEIKSQEEESLKDDMEVTERRVSDIRDCSSSDRVIILDAQQSTKIEVPFSPSSFFTKLSTEAKKICTSLKEEGRIRKERITDKSYTGKHSNLLEQSCVDESRDQKMNSKGEEEQIILRGSKENLAENITPPLSENQPERPELGAATINPSACDRDEQRREEVRSSLGGILLVVLVLWLVLESSVEPTETN